MPAEKYAKLKELNERGRRQIAETERKRLVDEAAGIIGEGVHTGLRKICDSEASIRAYNGITDLSNREWGEVLRVTAEIVVEHVQGEKHPRQLDADEWEGTKKNS